MPHEAARRSVGLVKASARSFPLDQGRLHEGESWVPACRAQDRVHDHSWLQLADSIGLRAED